MKMHGLGNDFVVIDARVRPVDLTTKQITLIADRHFGVGFDQLAVITAPHEGAQGAAHLTFYNADGSISATCGNATRCIARHLMDEASVDALSLTTDRGTLQAQRADEMVRVNMGLPQMAWRDIPLAQDLDIDALPIPGAPSATGMGNPHCTFFVENAETVDLETRGAEIEHHPLFPARTNVQFASLVAPNHLRVRVWERGVGRTWASGSSSCAVAVAAARRGLTEREVRLDLDGGTIWVTWADDGVWMTGPTAHVFSGVLTAAFLDSVE